MLRRIFLTQNTLIIYSSFLTEEQYDYFFVRNNLTFTFYPGCELQILSSTSYDCPRGPSCQRFLASNLLTLGTDHQNGSEWNGVANYWLTENGKKGEDQGFIMDLGCVTTAMGLSLRNTHNLHNRDRSTKKFRLLGSLNISGPWNELLVADLEDSRNQNPPPVKTLTFANSAPLRFVKFELLDYWGKGGGLQYFAVLTTTTTTPSQTTGCGNDWEAYDDHCYYWSNNTKTWYEAEAFCQQENGNLASITSDAINQYVVEGMNSRGLSNTWMGGNDIDEEGAWKWTDGSPFEFTFWHSGEPNNWGGNQHCMNQWKHGQGIKWDDRRCSNSLTFLCSKKKSSGKREKTKHGFIMWESLIFFQF